MAPVSSALYSTDMRALARTFATLVALTTPAAAQKPAALVGAVETFKATAASGFVDDVVVVESSPPGRLAYIVADASTKSELHIVTLADKTEVIVDLAPAGLLHATQLAFHGATKLFVVNQLDDGRQAGAMVDLVGDVKAKRTPGAALWKLEPATHVTLVTLANVPRIALHRQTANAEKKTTRHEIEVISLDSGKRVGAVRALELDANNLNAGLELKVNHFIDGYTKAIGVKSGTYNKKADTREPDKEATYDLVNGKLLDLVKITDLFEQRKRFQTLADGGGRADFVRMAWDNQSVQIWKAQKLKTVELDQPILQYDIQTLQGSIAADGSAWILLKVDPVNAAAVARKKADPEYFDIFKIGTDGKGTRKLRVLASGPGARYRFGVVANADRVWLLERNAGFERGGKTLTVLQAQ